ncbi:MAG TPA: carotenoid oxygenase family protein [Acidimicrobiales bacterium]|nr:carotenoid oxygenase family protein [Acidimicrobiales bacterium]
MVIGIEQASLPMEGALPPDLEGTFFRVGPRSPWAQRSAEYVEGDGSDERASRGTGTGAGAATDVEPDDGHPDEGGLPVGALHAVEFRDGKAVTYRWSESDADASVFWHAGSVLALSETGLPSQYSRFLEPEDFSGSLSVPIASHVHRVASDGTRVLFAVDERGRTDSTPSPTPVDGAREGIWLRIGEWAAGGALQRAQAVELERATWQHDIAVTPDHVVFIESPTTPLGDKRGHAVPFGWVPGAEGWLGVVPRDGDGTAVRWFRLDPCLVTHVLGAWEEDTGDIVLFVCRYDAIEAGRPYDPTESVVGPRGVGLTSIGGSLALLERWRVTPDRVERAQVDDRYVEYPRMDAVLDGLPFRYGYTVEQHWADAGDGAVGARRSAGMDPHAVFERDAAPIGLLKFDVSRDEAVAWHPGPGRRPSEPLFVRAVDGRGDDEGWLLSVVEDVNRGTSDIYVLDASSMGRRGPEAVIHLPLRLPLRSHGEWVPADRYR